MVIYAFVYRSTLHLYNVCACCHVVRSFGLRNVCVLGCIIATIGFTASIFSPTLNMMIFTQGVIGGIGIGLTYLPSIVAPNFYFEDQKAVAYGIGICGQGKPKMKNINEIYHPILLKNAPCNNNIRKLLLIYIQTLLVTDAIT